MWLRRPAHAAWSFSALFLGSAGNGGRRIDDDKEPPRAEGHDEQARGRGERKGLDCIRPHDHAAGAAEVGLPLRPTELLIFGNAKGGTPLMQSAQTIGVDLPLKALVWQDASGNTWLSYNDPGWLAKRHGLGHEVDAAVSAIADALHALAKAAAASP